MYNGLKQQQLQKEAALHPDNQLRNYIWDQIHNNPRISTFSKNDAVKLLNDDTTTPFQLQDWVNKSVRTPVNTSVAPAQPDQVKIQALNVWSNQFGSHPDRAVYYDVNAQDAYKIVVTGLHPSTMFPAHELQILQQAMGSGMRESEEGLRIMANPQVWKRFVGLQHMWLPKPGMSLPDPLAVVIGKDGSTYYLNPNEVKGKYLKQGDVPDEKGNLPTYTLQDIEKGAKKRPLSNLLKDNDGQMPEGWDSKFKVPFNKKIKATVQPVNFRTSKFVEKTMALVLNIDPHSPIFHSTDPQEQDIETYVKSIGLQNVQVDTRGKITIMLNTKIRGENPDPSVAKVSDGSVQLISSLIDWLNGKGFDTSEIADVMKPYDSRNRIDRSVQKKVDTRQNAALTQEEISRAMHLNDRDSMKDAMAYAGVKFDLKDPAQQFQLVEHLRDKMFELYPTGFNNDIFPDEMKKKQAEAIALAVTRKSVVMADQPGSGKCLPFWQVCQIDGRLIEIGKIWEMTTTEPVAEAGGEVKTLLGDVTCLDKNGLYVSGKAIGVYREKYQSDIFAYRTRYGRDITATPAHKFYTLEGWKNSLQVGDVVLSPKKLMMTNPSAIRPDFAEFLTWQISEGCEYKDTYSLSITQNDVQILNRLKLIFDSFGYVTSNHTNAATKATIVKHSNGKASCIGLCCKQYVQYLASIGYQWGNKSREKRLPDCFLQASDDVVKVILRAYFDAEGWVEKKGTIGVISASQFMIKQIGYLLQRFGILHSFRTTMKIAKNGKMKEKLPYYQISLVGDGPSTFMQKVGFSVKEKEAAWNSYNVNNKNINLGCKPIHIYLKSFFEKYPFTRELFDIPNAGYIDGTRWASFELIDRLITRFKMLKDGSMQMAYEESKLPSKARKRNLELFKRLDIKDVDQLNSNLISMRDDNFIYEEIISVEKIPYDDYVYDLTVAEHHNYIAEGLHCHNTFMSSASADYFTKMQDAKKPGSPPSQILVISPNGLIPQNWTTRALGEGVKGDPSKGQFEHEGQWYKPSAVRQFCNPQMGFEQSADGMRDADIQVMDGWGQNVDPSKRWVIANYDMFTDAGDPKEVQALAENLSAQTKTEADPAKKAALLKEAKKKQDQVATAKDRLLKIAALKKTIQKGNFVCVLLDESQLVKNDNSRTKHVAEAIGKIGKRIAMTGTPADDNPADLYGQLVLIDHPILYRIDPSTGKPFVDPNTGKKARMDKTVFAQQFFGGFGLKNTKIDVEEFKRTIPQRVKDTIMFLDMLADFFVRREKDDINPTIVDKKSERNFVKQGMDEDGNPYTIDEGSYPQIQEKALYIAAGRKAAKAKKTGKPVTLDEKAQEKMQQTEDDEFQTMDEQDLGEDDEDIDGIPVSAGERQAALAALQNNPAERQGAILRHVAEIKIPTTVQQALDILMPGEDGKLQTNFEPPTPKPDPKKPEQSNQVVIKDAGGAILPNSRGTLLEYIAKIDESDPFNKKRTVYGRVQGANGQITEVERNNIVPANPFRTPKKVFIVTKYKGVAKKIHAQLEAQLGKGVVGLVTGDTDERTAATEAFEKRDNPQRGLVMTMKLGSVGYNFQVADTAIFNDVSWNPSENEQASDRVYRITSPRDVRIIYNSLAIGEDAQMHSMIQAKEESNKKIQACIKIAYQMKKELVANPNEYQLKMGEAAMVFLNELAESMRQHQEAKRTKGTIERNTGNSAPQASMSEEPAFAEPAFAKGNWYRQFKTATVAYRYLW